MTRPPAPAIFSNGIGLELDEYPFLARNQDLELAEGMIVALEPKRVFPGEGGEASKTPIW